ncbi:MAG: apolipoprotein N-acyltransferase [Ruminococcaceae bacterium]|nr:apolipoprotein N-acyltransferase [Oscillospiraceae bacterium]
MISLLKKIAAQPWLRSSHGMNVLLIVSGLLTGLCVCFPVLGVLEWVSLVPALIVFFLLAGDADVPLRRLYRCGFVYNYAFSVVIFHWFFYMYPLEFTGVPRLVALAIVLVATLGLSLLQSLFAALLPVVLALVSRGRIATKLPFLQIIVTAALWGVREWAQTLNWTGVPWGRLALGQASFPLMLQTASWFGPYFVTFIIVLVNGCIAYALLHADRRRLCALVGVGVFALQLTCGGIIMLTDTARATEEPIKVAAIQGNVGSADKWDASNQETFDIYYELTVKAAEQGADVIVWPETAVPIDFDDYAGYRDPLISLAREHEVVLVLGAFVHESSEVSYNAVRLIDETGTMREEFYAKRHLVPFGEYVPLRPVIEAVLPFLTEISMLSTDTEAGEDAAVFETNIGQIGSLVCFDSIYEQLALDAAREGAELICIVTNDSWFFDSAAVHMHNAQAKLRAIETGRYVVRAANTGVSSIITPTGKELARLDALKEGIVTSEVEMRQGMTLYTRIGNLFVYVCLAGCAVLLAERAVNGIDARVKRAKAQK